MRVGGQRTGLSKDGAEGQLVGGEDDVVRGAAAAPGEDREAARGAVGEGPVAEVPEELGVGEPDAPREGEQHLVAVLLEALPPASAREYGALRVPPRREGVGRRTARTPCRGCGCAG